MGGGALAGAGLVVIFERLPWPADLRRQSGRLAAAGIGLLLLIELLGTASGPRNLVVTGTPIAGGRGYNPDEIVFLRPE